MIATDPATAAISLNLRGRLGAPDTPRGELTFLHPPALACRSARLAGRAQLVRRAVSRDNPESCCGARPSYGRWYCKILSPTVRFPPSHSSPLMRCEGRVVATSDAAGGGFHGAGRRDGIGWPSSRAGGARPA